MCKVIVPVYSLVHFKRFLQFLEHAFPAPGTQLCIDKKKKKTGYVCNEMSKTERDS